MGESRRPGGPGRGCGALEASTGACSGPSLLWRLTGPLSSAQDTHRSLFIQQLRPTQNLQPRIKLKLFGHSGSGKTTLVESLKCGLLRSFFRRRRPRLSSTNSTRFPPSPLASKPAGRCPHPGPRRGSRCWGVALSGSGSRVSGGLVMGAGSRANWIPAPWWL